MRDISNEWKVFLFSFFVIPSSKNQKGGFFLFSYYCVALRNILFFSSYNLMSPPKLSIKILGCVVHEEARSIHIQMAGGR